MKIALEISLAVLFALCGSAAPETLPPPHFHHLALNSTDPEAAIAFYTKEFPSTSRTTWEGMPALMSPTHVLVVFRKVAREPDADMEATAYWHFGWAVTDSRASLQSFRSQNLLVPFYTDDTGDYAGISSDTFPYPPGVPGRTRAQLAEAIAQGLKPTGIAGNGYIHGPDGAVVEFTGNAPAERFDHIHMWQDDPLCAQLWYQTHLEAKPRRPLTVTQADCKAPRGADRSWPSLTREGTYRAPTGGVSFDDVAMNWYPNQTDTPLKHTQGRLMDHISLSVRDLDAWVAKLTSEDVTILRGPYTIGATRAVMIQGPSREAIELIEEKP